MVKADTETTIICSHCGEEGVLREVSLVENGVGRKISYETHHGSIIDPGHIAALGRAENFYKGIFTLIAEFNNLPEESKIIRVENPSAAGRLIALDFQSHRPSACKVRTDVTPWFTFKTFSKEYEINLERRELASINMEDLLAEVADRTRSIIEDARDRALLGLS